MESVFVVEQNYDVIDKVVYRGDMMPKIDNEWGEMFVRVLSSRDFKIIGITDLIFDFESSKRVVGMDIPSSIKTIHKDAFNIERIVLFGSMANERVIIEQLETMYRKSSEEDYWSFVPKLLVYIPVAKETFCRDDKTRFVRLLKDFKEYKLPEHKGQSKWGKCVVNNTGRNERYYVWFHGTTIKPSDIKPILVGQSD